MRGCFDPIPCYPCRKNRCIAYVHVSPGSSHLHGGCCGLKTVLVRKFVHDPQAVFQFFLWLGIHVSAEDVRRFPTQAAVMPCTRILHQYCQGGAIVADVCPALSKHPAMAGHELPSICQDIYGMRPDSCQDFTVCILRCRGIKMFPVHAYFPIAVRLQPFIPAHIEALWRQYQQSFPVLFKQFPDRYLLFVVEFLRLLIVLQKELLIVFFYL